MGTLITRLLPLGDIVTPNIPEAEKLCGFEIHSEEDMLRAAQAISAHLSEASSLKAAI